MGFTSWIASGVAVAIFAYLSAPLAKKGQILTARDPTDAPGDFVRGSNGNIHYSLKRAEKSNNELVVLVHGFAGASSCWPPTMDRLASEGYDSLIFDLHGRGFSEVLADIPHSSSLFVGQLAELLFALNIDKPVHLVGWSMGGAIVSEFARIFPDRVSSLVLLCSAGMPTVKPLVAHIVPLPYVGEMAVNAGLLNPEMLVENLEAQWGDVEANRESFEVARERQLHHARNNPALFPSLLSTLRNFPLDTLESTFRLIGNDVRLKDKILLLWGELDNVCPLSGAQEMDGFMDNAKLVVVPNTSHGALLENPDAVHGHLVSFLKGVRRT